MSKIGLAEAIENLRTELTEAIEKGEGQALRFVVDGIELELAVEITREGNGKVGFNVLGVELGGGGGASKTNANRVKVSLKLPGDPKDTLISQAVPKRPD